MTLEDNILAAVAERAAQEKDPQTLHRLILDINLLLDAIEKRVAEMDCYRTQSGEPGCGFAA